MIAGARRPRPRAILLDFYGTIVEEDDPVVAGICREIAAASRTRATVDEIALSWWRFFQGLCTASYGNAFRCQRDLERASLETVLEQCAADLAAEDLSARLGYELLRSHGLPASYHEIEAGDHVLGNVPREGAEAVLAWLHEIAFLRLGSFSLQATTSAREGKDSQQMA